MAEVCIIGAGISGIVASKICLDHNLTPFIIEKSNSSGGLWKSSDNELGVWRSMKMNTSKAVTSLSDHPWPSHVPEYPSSSDALIYFRSYALKHSLEQYVHFNSEVKEIRRVEESYLVRFCENGEIIEKVFKFVICASGFYSKPADGFEGKDEFKGLILHSSQYRQPTALAGKKVLVVGRAFSSGDIAEEVSRTALKVTQVYRKPYMALRRKVLGLPSDFYYFNISNRNHIGPIVSSMESNFELLKMMEQLIGNPGEILEDWRITEEDTKKGYINFSVQIDEYYDAVKSGKIECIRGELSRFCENGILLTDGRVLEADAVILATGYYSDYDYLHQEIKDIIRYDPKSRKGLGNLYRSSIHPDLPGLAFVGSFHGFFTSQYEIQSELALKWFEGTLNVGFEELRQGVELEERCKLELPDSNFIYDFGNIFYDYLRILGIEIDYNFLKELGYQNGPYCSVFFWKNRPGQEELIRNFVNEMKSTYPEHNFDEVQNPPH